MNLATKRKLTSLPSLLAAILLIIGPRSFFQPCPNTEKVMKCHWSVQALVPLALILAFIAIWQLTHANHSCFKLMSLLALVCSLMPLLITLWLIGGCMKPEMACNVICFPTINGLSILASLAQCIALFSKTA
ncbi:MAG: DUF4418 family protein [Prevotellaceae bacterium]|nr:DUF4418 family protein [Prevotellaceae bacterium]